MNPHQIKNLLWMTWTLTIRDIKARYGGSALGVGWLFANPVLMLALYTAIFNGVFKARIGATDQPESYALSLSCGLLFFGFLSELLARSPTVISASPNFVKKVIFPLPVLCIVNTLSALFTSMAYALILILLAVWQGHWQWEILPAMALCTVLVIPMGLGLSLLLGSIGVFLRDLQQIMGPVISILLFTSPIFYPASAIPEALHFFLTVNPISIPIEVMRSTTMDLEAPTLIAVLAYGASSLAVMILGYAVFKRLRPAFADVL